MNILEVSIETKNHCLNKAFKEGTVYLSIPSMTGSPGFNDLPSRQATFTIGNGMATLADPVQFAVPPMTIVDKVYISNTPLLNNDVSSSPNMFDVIELEGSEIVDFTEEAGIYLISVINITLTERNE